MGIYRMSIEIELDAKSPLDAAKEFKSWITDNESELVYVVQDMATDEIYSVDLSEEDEDAVMVYDGYTSIIKL